MIPVIDAGALDDGESAARRALCDAIGEACRGTGFFYVTGHGVPETLIAAAYEQAARFHALPEGEKRRYHIANSRNHRGYVPPGEEDYGDEPGVGRKASFDLAADLPADDSDYVAGYRFLGPNVWPALPGFRETVGGYYEAVMAFGRRLLPAFAHALDLPEDTFASMFTKPTSNLRLLHYPAPEPDTGSERLRLGIGSHTDSRTFGSNVLIQRCLFPPDLAGKRRIGPRFLPGCNRTQEGIPWQRFTSTNAVSTNSSRASPPTTFATAT